MTQNELKRIRKIVDERSYPGEWAAGGDGDQRSVVYQEPTGYRIASCGLDVDAAFLEAADTWMGRLIDEVVRLRAIARTLALTQGMSKADANDLLDGDDL